MEHPAQPVIEIVHYPPNKGYAISYGHKDIPIHGGGYRGEYFNSKWIDTDTVFSEQEIIDALINGLQDHIDRRIEAKSHNIKRTK